MQIYNKKNTKGGLSQLITTIFLVLIAIYLINAYRISVCDPTKDLIKSGNTKILQMDKQLNTK